MFWKNKKKGDPLSKIVLGMVIIQDDKSFDPKKFQKTFKKNYDLNIKEVSDDKGSYAFKIDGELVVVVHMPMPIPYGDLEGTAEYSYNWETALDDLKTHESHLIVSVANGGQDQIKRFKIFTQVISILLKVTNSLGVYKGAQSLLVSKDDYLNEASLMTGDYLPLNLWIYFGYRVTDYGNSSYTYGLKEFDKTEMEIIDSSKSIEEISKFLFNITYYVLDNNVTFKDGQTCGMSANEIVSISFSKGKLIEGDTFKLAY